MRPVRTQVSVQSLLLMGVPKQFSKCTIEDFKSFGKSELQSIKDFMCKYLDSYDTTPMDEQKGLYIYGSNGVGKSMLASITLRVAYTHRYSCRFLTFADYLTLHRNVWNSSFQDIDEAKATLDLYKSCEFLVLEEIGKEIDSKISTPILEDLMRFRENKCLVTVITTNITTKALEEHYGASISSLLHGSCVPLKITGSDKRGVKM